MLTAKYFTLKKKHTERLIEGYASLKHTRTLAYTLCKERHGIQEANYRNWKNMLKTLLKILKH